MKPYETKTDVEHQHNTFQGRLRIKTLNKYFQGKLYGRVLYVGEEDKLAKTIFKSNDIAISYIDFDLDIGKLYPLPDYNIIIMSHVIEHLFNPLHALTQLRKQLKRNGVMYVILPQRPKFLWTENHFHEIDDKRIKCLFDRAGLEIIEKAYHPMHKQWYTMFFGIRMFLRFFFYRKATIYKLRRSKYEYENDNSV